jgi:hypothetical protein
MRVIVKCFKKVCVCVCSCERDRDRERFSSVCHVSRAVAN